MKAVAELSDEIVFEAGPSLLDRERDAERNVLDAKKKAHAVLMDGLPKLLVGVLS